jgi:hypothetical protein
VRGKTRNLKAFPGPVKSYQLGRPLVPAYTPEHRELTEGVRSVIPEVLTAVTRKKKSP